MIDELDGMWRRVSMVMENRTCKEVIESLIAQYDLSVELIYPEPVADKQGTGECEECGGPCRWEYADWYGEETSK